MLVERAIIILDNLYRVSIHLRTLDSKNTYAKSRSLRAKEDYFSKSYLRSPSPEPMEGVEFTGKFGKKRLSDKEYSRRMKEGCCYNCGRKGHRAQDCSSRFNARRPEDETKKKASKVASVSTNRGKSKEKFRKTTIEDASSYEFKDISSSSEEDSGKE